MRSSLEHCWVLSSPEKKKLSLFPPQFSFLNSYNPPFPSEHLPSGKTSFEQRWAPSKESTPYLSTWSSSYRCHCFYYYHFQISFSFSYCTNVESMYNCTSHVILLNAHCESPGGKKTPSALLCVNRGVGELTFRNTATISRLKTCDDLSYFLSLWSSLMVAKQCC